jgi:RNA polymerase sigma-70 factor (ECF subfamily)
MSEGRPEFATTHWSLVARAGGEATPARHEALAVLCERYWYPLYVYVRRRGQQPAEAQDLTQAFFAELLEKNRLRMADQQRGKFRSFLLSSLNHFLANVRRGTRSLKRGGGTTTLSLDFESGERRFLCEPAHELTAERAFERRWALTLLERALDKLRDEHTAAGKEALFEALKTRLGGDPEAATYGEIATSLEMTEGALKVAAHRMRRRCRELLRDEIAQTVAGPDEVDEELRDLFAALG